MCFKSLLVLISYSWDISYKYWGNYGDAEAFRTFKWWEIRSHGQQFYHILCHSIFQFLPFPIDLVSFFNPNPSYRQFRMSQYNCICLYQRVNYLAALKLYCLISTNVQFHWGVYPHLLHSSISISLFHFIRNRLGNHWSTYMFSLFLSEQTSFILIMASFLLIHAKFRNLYRVCRTRLQMNWLIFIGILILILMILILYSIIRFWWA